MRSSCRPPNVRADRRPSWPAPVPPTACDFRRRHQLEVLAMAHAGKVEVPYRAPDHLTMTVTVRVGRLAAARLWLGGRLMALAARIAGVRRYHMTAEYEAA